MAWRKIITSPVLWAVWLVTRAVLYLLATAPRMTGDVGIYQHWYACCFSHGAFPVGRPDVAVPARRGPGLLAARPPARQLRGLFRVPGHSAAIWPSRSCCARRPGAAGPWPGPGTGCAACRCSARSAVSRFDVVPSRCRSPPCAWPAGRRPRRADRSRGGGQAMAGHAAGRDGSRPVAPRCRHASGRAGRGLRHLRPRNGELPRAPGRPRRRDRIGRRDAVHDLAASRLARDGRVPVRRLAAQRGTRRARAGRVRPGPGPRGGGGARLAAVDRRRPRPVAAGVRGRRAAGRDACCSWSPARCSARSTCSGSSAWPRRAWPPARRRSARSRWPCWPPPGSRSWSSRSGGRACCTDPPRHRRPGGAQRAPGRGRRAVLLADPQRDLTR